MRTVVALTLAAMAALATPAQSQQPECRPAAAFIASLEARGVRNHFVLSGRAQASAVELYNSIPPETNTPFSLAIIADLQNGYGLLAVGFDSSVCAVEMIPAEHYQRIRRVLIGQGV